MVRCLISLLLFSLIAGCSFATRSDVIQNNMRLDFKSTKSPGELAVCIDRNADESFGHTLRSKTTNIPGQPIEVMVYNGDTIYAVIQIEAVGNVSNAMFYLGGAALFGPEISVKKLTKDCK